MLPSAKTLLLTSIAMTMLAFPIPAQVIEQTGAHATAWFGLRGDSVRIGQGQSVTISVPATIWSISFLFNNTGNANDGIPPGTETDEIKCSLRAMESFQPLGYAVASGFTNPIPGTFLKRSLCFPLSLAVTPGQYVITCENQRQPSMDFTAIRMTAPIHLVLDSLDTMEHGSHSCGMPHFAYAIGPELNRMNLDRPFVC